MENHGQKRSADEQCDNLDGVNTLVFRVEGTITPITFAKDRLFPYVRENVKGYFEGHFDDEDCQEDITSLREQLSADKDGSVKGAVDIPDSTDDNKDAVVQALVDNVLWQMDEDRKTTSLKQLQSHMWREAYKTGLVQGEVFADVVPALKQWIDEGKKAYAYSCSSVESQKLLFGYSDKGNLMELFSGYFDTKVGAKDSKDSYSNISEELGAKPKEIVLFTHSPSEAKAAGEAGFRTILVSRKGNAPFSDEDKKRFNIVGSFGELANPEDKKAAKRLTADDDDDDDEVDDVDDDLDDLDGDDLDEADDDGADDDDEA